ncbi:MAG: hypothetical protein IJV74_06850 [Clostridia bacterium]|nr:hypothetical protein [Clostridia bacterium]
MNYFEKFEAQEQKLENILEDKCLLHKFSTNTYPMYLTISQNQTPDAQMALYNQDTDGVSSQDAKLVLTFPVGEIGVRVYGRLIIPDQLLNKIKNCGKKMRDLWLQGDYARRMESWTQPSAEDQEPLEETFEDDFEDEEESNGAEA